MMLYIKKVLVTALMFLWTIIGLTQSISADLEKLNDVMLNTSKYHIHITMVYQKKDGQSSMGEQFDLYKVNNTKMSIIGTNRTIMNESVYLGISTDKNIIKLLPVTQSNNQSGYVEQLREMEKSGMLELAVFSMDGDERKYSVNKPSKEILKMDISFDKVGYISKVVYYYNPTIQGNPYSQVSIIYEVSSQFNSYKDKGLELGDYVELKRGRYELTNDYKDFEFINLMDN